MFERRLLSGVQLRGTPLGDMLLNDVIVAEKKAKGIPVPVSVTILDQDNKPLEQPTEVFPGVDPLKMVYARLLYKAKATDNGVVVAEGYLTPGKESGQFEGSLASADGLKDPAGTYTVSFTFGDPTKPNTPDETRYQILTPPTGAVVADFKRVRRDGVSLKIIKPELNEVVSLNTLSAQKAQVPTTVTVQVQLVDLNGNPLTDLKSIFRPNADKNAVSSVLSSVDNQFAAEPLILTPDYVKNLFVGTFREAAIQKDGAQIDPVGKYTLTATLDPEALVTGPLSGYKVVADKADPVTFQRREQVGLWLRIYRLGDSSLIDAKGVPVKVEAPIRVPLFVEAADAAKEAIGLGSNIQGVPVQFAFFDTNNRSLVPDQLLKKSDMPPEKLLRVFVKVPGLDNVVEVTKFQQQEPSKGVFILSGEIPSNIRTLGDYEVTYALDPDMLADNVTNYSRDAKPQSVPMVRIPGDDFLRTPTTYRIIAGIVIVLLVLLIVYLVDVNRKARRLDGTITVTWGRNVTQPTVRTISLRRPFWLQRKLVSSKKDIEGKDGKRKTMKVTITTAPFNEKTAVSSAGLGGVGGKGSQTIRPRKVYRVLMQVDGETSDLHVVPEYQAENRGQINHVKHVM